MDKNTPGLIRQMRKDQNTPWLYLLPFPDPAFPFFFTYPFLLFFVPLLHRSSIQSFINSSVSNRNSRERRVKIQTEIHPNLYPTTSRRKYKESRNRQHRNPHLNHLLQFPFNKTVTAKSKKKGKMVSILIKFLKNFGEDFYRRNLLKSTHHSSLLVRHVGFDSVDHFNC